MIFIRKITAVDTVKKTTTYTSIIKQNTFSFFFICSLLTEYPTLFILFFIFIFFLFFFYFFIIFYFYFIFYFFFTLSFLLFHFLFLFLFYYSPCLFIPLMFQFHLLILLFG